VTSVIVVSDSTIQEEIKSKLKSGNACYLSVQSHWPSSLLSKNIKIVLYGCETWSLTLREERRLEVFENRVLKRIFEPKRDEVNRGV
jgi:hypothetical protein